ncbi:S8 family serine peptidase [Mucisphaera calidilacus]|uniref:S8 family serine peptidase n=1 Tax=Mucisphaera calidilacus TaxID=2527982 RepID=UPI0011A86787|nr:S8 family serine peptidase [Mucisphaera calidilacus]
MLVGMAAWGPGAVFGQQGRVDNRVRPVPGPGAGGESEPLRPAGPRATTVQAIGLDKARFRLGRDLPVGRDIIAGHVEGGATQYLPDGRKPVFDYVRFVPRSGPATPFDHATATAGVIYGRGGLAPGIRIVHCFSSMAWIGEAYLRVGTDEPPLEDDPIRVFSHSWITQETRGIEQVLRRVDYQIDTRDVVMAVGVNNGPDSEIPPALASAYNVIAVGTTNGRSSGGRTPVDGIGRCKPDLVAPGGQTSFATPAVAAAAASLLEAADRLEADGEAGGRSEVVKAVLMAGATKSLDWRAQPGRPLAERFGAGTLNIDNALKIMQNPRLALPSLEGAGEDDELPRIRRRYGWAFESLATGETRSITIKANRLLGPVSLMLVWNRQIKGEVIGRPFTPKPVWLPRPLLSNLDMRLVALPDEGGVAAEPTVFAESRSRLDNVEHLYIHALPPGVYRLEITRRPFPLTYEPELQDYALAWRIELPEEQADEAAGDSGGASR